MSEREILLAALDRDDPSERARYLDQACAGDTALRQRIEALLRSHERPGDSRTVPVGGHAPAAPSEGTLSYAGAQRSKAGDPTLYFLTPSQKPGSLGRLDHYEMLAVIGRGGMGVVLRAFDEKLHRVVAVKVLAPHLAASDQARQRFVREARAAAAVRHDNVIGIYAVEDAGGIPYLVMEFIDGLSLEDKLRQGGPLEVKEVLRVGLQIAAGLAAAHQQGLVHRDIKPANILLDKSARRVKITDFGLARAVDDASLTQSGLVVGTPAYMSPEQANGDPVDHRSDLFSLGSLLYRLCTGGPPFYAASTPAVLKRVRDDAPCPPRGSRPTCRRGWKRSFPGCTPKTRPTVFRRPGKWPMSLADTWSTGNCRIRSRRHPRLDRAGENQGGPCESRSLVCCWCWPPALPATWFSATAPLGRSLP